MFTTSTDEVSSVNSKKNNGKILEARFIEIISWVNEALDANKSDEV